MRRFCAAPSMPTPAPQVRTRSASASRPAPTAPDSPPPSATTSTPTPCTSTGWCWPSPGRPRGPWGPTAAAAWAGSASPAPTSSRAKRPQRLSCSWEQHDRVRAHHRHLGRARRRRPELAFPLPARGAQPRSRFGAAGSVGRGAAPPPRQRDQHDSGVPRDLRGRGQLRATALPGQPADPAVGASAQVRTPGQLPAAVVGRSPGRIRVELPQVPEPVGTQQGAAARGACTPPPAP